MGRKHVATQMRRMGIEALYRKPHTSRRHPQHKIYPYLLRGLKIVSVTPSTGLTRITNEY